MKKNLAVLLVVIVLASFTSLFGGMPSTWGMFLKGFTLCFVFWCAMFAPAFNVKN